MSPPCGSQSKSCAVHASLEASHSSPKRRSTYVSSKTPVSQLFQRFSGGGTPRHTNTSIQMLPTETLLAICHYLPLHSRCILAFTSQAFMQKLSSNFWPDLSDVLSHREKNIFLELLAKDLPNTIACTQCMRLHRQPSLRPSWLPGTSFDRIYHLSRSQVHAAKLGKLCPGYLTCSRLISIRLHGNNVTTGVWYRPRVINGRFIMNRHYVFPRSPNAITPNVSTPDPPRLAGLRLCKHVHLSSLSAGDFPPLAVNGIGSRGAGWSGYTEQIYPSAIGNRNAGYYLQLRCPKCRMECYFLRKEEDDLVSDVYNEVWESGDRRRARREGTRFLETMRGPFEGAGNLGVKPDLW